MSDWAGGSSLYTQCNNISSSSEDIELHVELIIFFVFWTVIRPPRRTVLVYVQL